MINSDIKINNKKFSKMNIILDPKQFRIEKTTRGAPCLIFENYKFRYGNKMKDEIRWRCTNKLCKATIKTNEKGITEKRTVHDHEPVCERKSTKKSSRISSRIKSEPVSYYRPHSHFVDCSDNFDNAEPSFIQQSVDSTRINRNGSTGVCFIKNEYQSDIDEVIAGNETPSHFMDLLLPPANPSQQPQQQTPQPSPQVQPQPSPPPVVTQKKSSLPPLAPKPVGNKLPQSSGAQNVKQPPKLLPKPQSPPEVCLRWNSYHSNMQNTFPSLLNNEQFVDVTLACDGRSIKCHKVMLSACSPYMEELLSSNPCQHPIIFLKDMKFWQLQALVDFMYRGEVNVTQDKLPNLLSAAEALQIKGLASPVNHTAPPKITQVQPMPTTQHDLSDEMDQVTYMRQLQLKSEVKPDYDDEYMQDTDDSPPPTPKLKKRKTSHTIPQSQSHNNGTLSSNGNKSLSMDIKKERKRDKERHSEPSTSQHILSTAQALLNQQNEQRRRSDADKLTDSENEYKNYGDDNRHGSNQDEDLDIDEEHAQMILERYSSQNEDCYSRGGDGDLDDNSTTSG